MWLSFRDNDGGIRKILEEIKVSKGLLTISQVFYTLIFEYVENNKENKQLQKLYDGTLRVKALRMSRDKFNDELFSAHSLPNLKESLLKLIIKKADIKTVYECYKKSIQLSKFDINNKESWRIFKKLKIEDFIRIKEFVEYITDERHLPKKYVVDNVGFDTCLKRSITIDYDSKNVKRIENA